MAVSPGRVIYFRDNDGVLKGPYTESEVQRWYRESWFHSSVQFQLRNGPDDEHAPFVTLEDLRNKNGIKRPFADDGKFKEEQELIEKRLHRLEEELDGLSSSVAQKSIEDRIARIERDLENLKITATVTESVTQTNQAATPPTTASSTAEKTAKVEQSKASTSKQTKEKTVPNAKKEPFPTNVPLAKEYDRERAQKLARVLQLTANPRTRGQAKKLLFELFPKKILWCCVCDLPMIGDKSIVMHFCSNAHKDAIEALSRPELWRRAGELYMMESNRIVELYNDIVNQKWGHDEIEKYKIGRIRYAMMEERGLLDALAPAEEFMQILLPKIHCAFDQINKVKDDVEKVYKWSKDYFDSPGARQALAFLQQQLEHAQPICRVCKVVCENADEFYEHVAGFNHTEKQHHRDPNDAEFSCGLTQLITYRYGKNYPFDDDS